MHLSSRGRCSSFLKMRSLHAPRAEAADRATWQMLFNMIGNSLYQLVVCVWILFYGPSYFNIVHVSDLGRISARSRPRSRRDLGYLCTQGIGSTYEREHPGEASVHLTILFNSFVMMTLFNARRDQRRDAPEMRPRCTRDKPEISPR